MTTATRPGWPWGRIGDAVLVFLAWTTFAIAVSASYTVRGGAPLPVPFTERLQHVLPFYWIWAALTPGILATSGWLQAHRRAIWLTVAAHAAVIVAAALVHLALYVPVSLAIGAGWSSGSFGWHYRGTVERHLLGNLLAATSVILIWTGATYRRRIRDELARARLEALRMQLEPHFLFNSLQAAASLLRQDPTAAEEMLERLAEFLRLVLRRDERQLVPLAEELELLDHYLAVMRVRFSDRLRVAIRVDERLHRVLVPVLVLQPLVENAIQHGIARRAAGGTLEICAELRNDRIVLRISDDGPGLGASPGARVEERIGLSNTRARLQQLYGSRHAVRLTSGPAAGTTTEVELPVTLARERDLDAPRSGVRLSGAGREPRLRTSGRSPAELHRPS